MDKISIDDFKHLLNEVRGYPNLESSFVYGKISETCEKYVNHSSAKMPREVMDNYVTSVPDGKDEVALLSEIFKFKGLSRWLFVASIHSLKSASPNHDYLRVVSSGWVNVGPESIHSVDTWHYDLDTVVNSEEFDGMSESLKTQIFFYLNHLERMNPIEISKDK